MPRTSTTLAALDKQIEAATAGQREYEARAELQSRLVASLQEARAVVAVAIRKRKAKTPPTTGATP